MESLLNNILGTSMNLLSGALGALIVLFVGLYIGYRRKIYERLLQHVNSLIILELRLMDINAGLHDNRIMFNELVEGAENNRIVISLPSELLFEEQFFKDSLVIELSQRLYEFRYLLNRYNKDTAHLSRSYALLSEAMTLGNIEEKNFSFHLNGLLEQKDVYSNALDELQELCTKNIGYVRARIHHDKTWLMNRRNKILTSKMVDIQEDEINNEINLYLAQIKENNK